MFGKSFDTSKFKNTINNALARIAMLKKQHHACWSQARSDVVQLLNLGHQESAILRVDHVIREQNLLDALVIIEGYSCLLLERVALIRNAIKCPEELKEAIASLIFAASRYGQLPELQKISRIFMKKYGKEFINNAIELRNSCGVNAKVKMIALAQPIPEVSHKITRDQFGFQIAKRLPNRRTSLGTRLKILKEIAGEHGITLQQEDENPDVTEEKMNPRKTTRSEGQEPDIEGKYPEEIMEDEIPKARNKYTDVKQAAQSAFELASQAAAAARAAVVLSQTKFHDDDPDDSNHRPRKAAANHNEDASLKEMKPRKEEDGLDKNDAFEANFRKFNTEMSNKSFRSQSKEAGPSNIKAERQRIPSVFTSESDADTDGKQDESKSRPSKHPWLEHHDWDNTDKKFSSFMKEFLKVKNSDADKDENHSNETQDCSSRYSSEGITREGSSRGRRPISVRTRRSTATPRRSRRPVSVRP